MVRIAKFLVLLGGIAGVAAFFLPFVTVASGGDSASLSAYQAVRGVDVIEDNMGKGEAPPQAQEELQSVLDRVKGFLYGIYAPSVLMILFGLIGVIKGKFGRGFGLVSFLLGGLTLGVWGLIAGVAGGSATSLGLGVHLLAVAGALGVVGGLVNSVKPDHG